MAERPDNRSLGDLLGDLSRETATLVRKEFELATTETTRKVKAIGGQVAIGAAGGALIHAGLLVLLAAVVMALAQLGIPSWLSALIVSVLTMVTGYVLVNRARSSMSRTTVLPTQTIETLKENAKWTRGQRA